MIGVVSYLVFFSTMAAILAIAVLGLNLQWGNTGLFNGGVAAFLPLWFCFRGAACELAEEDWPGCGS